MVQSIHTVPSEVYFAKLAQSIEEFRAMAYGMSAAFGQEVDKLIAQGAFLGEGEGQLTTILNNLVSGLQSAAQSAQLSMQNYYQAQTNVQNMQRANAAGLTLEQYLAATQLSKTAAAATSVPNTNAFSSSLLGIPVWVWFGGAALFLMMSNRK